MLRKCLFAVFVAVTGTAYGQTPRDSVFHVIPRFPFEYTGLVSSGPARVGVALVDEGKRAALRGDEMGSLDVWTDGLLNARGVSVEFHAGHNAQPLDVAAVARTIVARPEGPTIVYSHPTFTVREHAFAALNDPGVLILLEVETVRPLRVTVTGHEPVVLNVDSARDNGQYYAFAFAGGDSAGVIRARMLDNVREYWQQRVAHARRVRNEALSIDAFDLRTTQALEWAKVANDRSMPAAPGTVEWLRTVYETWLQTGDLAALRDAWPDVQRALRIPVAGIDKGDSYRAALWVSALAGAQEMARALRQRADATRIDQQLAAAQRTLDLESDSLSAWPVAGMAMSLIDADRADRMLREIGSSNLTADWGVRLMSRRDTLYDPLRFDRGAVVPFATAIAALADYRYHRDWAGFDLLRDLSNETTDFVRGSIPPLLSGAYYQALGAAAPPELDAARWFVAAFVRGFAGWETDAANHAATLEPHMPAEWPDMKLMNLRVGHDRLDATISRVNGVYAIGIHRLTPGAPIALRVAPALPLGARIDRIVVNDADVPVQSEETAHDIHAVAEISLTGDAQVEVHYDGGIDVLTPAEHVEIGEASHELKVLDYRRDSHDYVITIEGVAGSVYTVQLRSTLKVRGVAGSDSFEQDGERVSIHTTMPAGTGFVRKMLRVRV